MDIPSTVREANAESVPSLFSTLMTNFPLSEGLMLEMVKVLNCSSVFIFILPAERKKILVNFVSFYPPMNTVKIPDLPNE